MNSNIRETVYAHDAGDDVMPELKGMFIIDAGERWSINMVKRLKEKYPDKVIIKHENKDGSIHAYMPLKWMKITPKGEGPKREYSEEEKQALRERMKAMHEQKNKAQLP